MVFDRGVGVVDAVVEVALLEQHHSRGCVERLEVEGRVLERRTWRGQKAHVMLIEQGLLVDARPDRGLAHEHAGVVHRIEDLAIAAADGEVLDQGVPHRILAGDVGAIVGTDDVEVVLLGRLVELLEHVDDGKVIGLNNADVLSAGNINALVHGVAVAAIGLIDNNDTLVTTLVLTDD